MALAAFLLAGCSVKLAPTEPGEISSVGVAFKMDGVGRKQDAPAPTATTSSAPRPPTTTLGAPAAWDSAAEPFPFQQPVEANRVQATTTTVTTSTVTSRPAETSTSTSTTRTSTTRTTTSTTTATTSTGAPTTTLRPGQFACESGRKFSGLEAMQRKGLCLDGMTFQDCPGAIPITWPNTESQPVASIRLYQPWDPSWGGDYKRSKAWSLLVDWVKKNNVRVLLGTQVSCDSDADEEMWFWTMELMKMLGKDHVMGIAIGNEMDIFRTSRSWAETECNNELWDGGYWKTLQHHVMDMDLNGFKDTKVTAVWSLGMLGSKGTKEEPFKEDSVAKASTLVKKASKKWPHRWVWAFNAYSIFDPTLWPSSGQDCAQRTKEAVAVGALQKALREVRRRVQLVTGRQDDVLWVGENGWSSHGPSSLNQALAACPEFASLGSFAGAYRSFLDWDLSLGADMQGVDHAFYYTIRDDPRTGAGFGLIKACNSSSCKVQSDGTQGLEAKFA